jgi:hypothetical protein
MNAWAAIAAKDVAGTTSLGNGILHGISPGALDGFAIGAMLTGLCFLVIVAPRSFRRSRLSAPPGLWLSFIRRSRAERDYYAEPADTYSLTAESEMIFAAAPVADDLEDAEAPEAAELGPADVAAAEDLTEGERVTAKPVTAEPVTAAPVTEAGSVTALAASRDFGGHAGADPYAAETAATSGAEPQIAAGEDAMVMPADERARPERGRGYRSKHRMTDREPGERRAEGRRGAPKHAAPSTGFGSRMSGRLAMFPLVAARG